MQIQTKFLANLAVTTAKIAALAVDASKLAADAVTTVKVLNDAITAAKIRLGNDAYLRGRNAADNADIDILKVNATDEVESNVQWQFPTLLPQSAVVPVAAEDLVNKAYVDSIVPTGVNGAFEDVLLDGTDITNQYVDLAEEALEDTLHVSVSGVTQTEGTDYSLSVEAGPVTRITFLGDLATAGAAALVAGDRLNCRYLTA